MATMTTTSVPDTRGGTVEPSARFRDLLAAEWIKLWSLRSTVWALVVTALTVLGFTIGTAYDQYRYWPDDPRHTAAFIKDGIAVGLIFNGNAATILVLALGAFGAMSVVGEYSTGQIRTTFAAVPARRSVMAAKVAVMAGVMAVFGAVVSLLSFCATQAILSELGVGVSIGHPGVVRVIVASALLPPVSAIIGMALAAVLRQAGAALVSTVAVLVLLPAIFSEDRYWSAVIDHSLLLSAWFRLTRSGVYGGVAHSWTTGGAWCVYAVWAVVAAGVAVAVVHRHDQ
ncbi:ABC transporter permease [Streptomyces cucumeris]|uniref:ABC transporter permease n=1 Tax=Streptomyces cucumeris TaxID=2962890 RepID=UPI003D6DD04B